MPDTRTEQSISAAKNPILLDQGTQIRHASEEWKKHQLLGVDTEFVRERTYWAGLGLVQISDGRTAWLADPLPEASRPVLADMLASPDNLKIFHSASEDLEVLSHSLGVLPEPMVDTQIACALLGQPLQLGYHHAIKWVFDIEIDKDQTRSNWLKRPLSQKQLEYAAMDVVLLPELWRTLESRLSSAGRLGWLQEEVQRMLKRAGQATEPANLYLRIGGAGRLTDDALRVLRSLAIWREEMAIRKDRARGFVVNDRAMMQMAVEQPTTVEGLKQLSEIHPRALPRLQDDLLNAIARGVDDTSAVARPAQLNPAQRQQMKTWRNIVQARAKELGVDPAMLASRKQLEQLLQATERAEDPPERFMGWREEILTKELLKARA